MKQILSASDNDWEAVIRNLQRERQKWTQLLLVMGTEGTDVRIQRMLYTTVVKAVIIYRLETRVMSPRIGKTLGGFNHWVVRRLTGRMPHRNLDGTWAYNPLEESIDEAVVQEVYTYTTHGQNTVTKFIATRPIMDLCLAAARRPGA